MNAYETSDDWAVMSDLLKAGKELLISKNSIDWTLVRSWNNFGNKLFFINHTPVPENELRDFLKGSGYRFIVPNKA